MDQEIRIRTSGDLDGINAVRNGLIGIRDLATEISNQGIGINGTGYVPTPNQPNNQGVNSNPMPQPFVFRNSPNPVPTPGQPSSFGSQGQGQGQAGFPTGEQVGTWMEINLPIIQGMMGGAAPQTHINVPGYNVNNGTYTPQSYQPIAPPNIANHVPIPEQTSTYANASSFNPMPNPSQPSYGRRTRPGMDWSAEGIAGAAGSLLTRALPIAGPLAAGLAIGDFAVNSYDKYKDSGDSLSGLTKQILSTKDSLESLQTSVNSAGATMAMGAEQTARITNSIGSAYGSLSMSSLSNKVSMVGGMGLAYGVNPDMIGQDFAGAARLGITTGVGSTMNQGQLAFGIANSAAQGGMNGRVEELMQEVLSSTQSIQSTSVTSNPSTLLGIITSMNATLPRSMQGQGGADIIGKMSSSMANPNGLQQIMSYQAMSNAGVKNYFDIMSDQQMGPGFILPNGQTNAEAIFGQYNKSFGSDPKQEAYRISSGLGMSIPQAKEMLKIFGPGGTGMASIQDNLGLTPDQLKGADWNKLALFGQLGASKSESDLQAVEKDYGANGGILSDDQKKALSSGTTDQKKKLLAQDILGGQYSPKTTTEKIETMNATVTNLQIKMAGEIANPPSTFDKSVQKGYSDAIKGFNSPSGIGGKFASGDIGGALSDILHGLESGLAGIFTAAGSSGITMTSFNAQSGTTPGGYGYSNGMTATTVGMNGMNNAFSWLSNRGNRQNGTSGGIQTVSFDNSSSGSSPSSSILKGIMMTESSGNPYSLNDNTTGRSYSLHNQADYLRIGQGLLNAGDSVDMGLMQINSKAHPDVKLGQASDPSFAVNWASNYLSSLNKQEGGNWDKTIQAYNTGPGGVGSQQGQNYLGRVKDAEMNISDASLSKLGTAIANAILGNGGGWKTGPYYNT